MTAERAVELLVMFDEETQTQVECCGEPMRLVERDFAERKRNGKPVWIRRVPTHRCEKCGGSGMTLEVAILVEEMVESSDITLWSYPLFRDYLETISTSSGT